MIASLEDTAKRIGSTTEVSPELVFLSLTAIGQQLVEILQRIAALERAVGL